MGRVLVWGIGNEVLRRRLSVLLAEEWEIIGYTDTYIQEDYLQGERYIPIGEILNENWDYLIVLSDKEQVQKEIQEKVNKLSGGGGKNKRVVLPVYLYQKNLWYAPDIFQSKLQEFSSQYTTGLICGLSYSLYGIDESELPGINLNFSWHGMDLYYISKFLKKVLVDSKVQKLILVIPYYYFNYDMSSSLYQFKSGQIHACRGARDWHNAEEATDEIYNYQINERLFGTRLWEILDNKWKPYCGKMERKTDNQQQYELGSMWKITHESTIIENVEIMKEILMLCRKNHIEMNVVVPPLLTSCLYEGEIQYFEKTKRKWNTIMNSLKQQYSINIYDFCDIYTGCFEMFFDYEHLNEIGKENFTNIIRRKIYMN